MAEEQSTYLERELEADISKEDGIYTFIFQTEKIKLDSELEIQMLKEVNPNFDKEISMTRDELTITIQPPSSYQDFESILSKNDMSRWFFAHQLVHKVAHYHVKRLHLIVCPENIIFDRGLEPSLLHYGVAESIPPYEKDEERLWHELKATVAYAIEGKYTFEEYLNFRDTMKLSSIVKKILNAEKLEDLQNLIQKQVDRLEKQDKTLIHIPQKKWKIGRLVLLGLVVCLIPAIVYIGYSLFFLQPKQEAFAASSQSYLNKNYSKVVDTLEGYKMKNMPKVVRYELARSYVINGSLTKEQKDNALSLISLHSDPKYYSYWINIGRGNGDEALNIARSLEDRDFILFALLKKEEQVKADESLSGEDKQKKLDGIAQEKKKYQKEQEEEKKKDEDETTSSDVDEAQDNEQKKQDDKSKKGKNQSNEKSKNDDSGKKKDKLNSKSKKKGKD